MKPTAKSAASFLSGASVLTLSAVAVKIIGLFYRIPMLSHLGTEGMDKSGYDKPVRTFHPKR